MQLPNDLENYIRYKLTGGPRKKYVKEGVLPHIFDCQPYRKTATNDNSYKLQRDRLKCNQKKIIAKILAEDEAKQMENIVISKPEPLFIPCRNIQITQDLVKKHCSSEISKAKNLTNKERDPLFIPLSIENKILYSNPVSDFGQLNDFVVGAHFLAQL